MRSLSAQDPVEEKTKDKFTLISLIEYSLSTEFVMRTPSERIPLGYVIEPPKHVLETVFPDYHVTEYNEKQLFTNSPSNSNPPMLGLGINPIDRPVVYGIQYTGRLNEILELNKLIKAKRDNPITQEEIKEIIAYLSEPPHSDGGILNTQRDQTRHDKEEIISVISAFL